MLCTVLTVSYALRAFATKTTGQGDVLGLDRDTLECEQNESVSAALTLNPKMTHLSVDSSQVRVFEETNQVSLGGLLEGTNCRRLESQVGLEVLSDLTDQALERQLADQKLGRLLVASNFTQGDSTGLVTVRLLDCAREEKVDKGSMNARRNS